MNYVIGAGIGVIWSVYSWFFRPGPVAPTPGGGGGGGGV